MKLSDIKKMFGIESIEVKQWKENGSYMAEIGVGKESVRLFVTKATDINTVNDNSPVSLIDGKFYIGTMKEALNTKVI